MYDTFQPDMMMNKSLIKNVLIFTHKMHHKQKKGFQSIFYHKYTIDITIKRSKISQIDVGGHVILAVLSMVYFSNV